MNIPPTPVSEPEALSLLGLPDYGANDGTETTYVYDYSEGGKINDSSAVLGFDHGFLTGFGWGGTNINDYRHYTKFHDWSDVNNMWRMALLRIGKFDLQDVNAIAPPLSDNSPMCQPYCVARLVELSDRLRFYWGDYNENEANRARGDRFADLAMTLADFRISHPSIPVTEMEVLSFLGLPDCGMAYGRQTFYRYSYWSSASNSRWEFVAILNDGQLAEMGVNKAGVNNYSDFTVFQTWDDIYHFWRSSLPQLNGPEVGVLPWCPHWQPQNP